MSFLHDSSFQTYQALNQKLETLEQQMDEVSILLAQINLRREKLLARARAKLQSMSAAVQFESATINIPEKAEIEPMTPPTKDIGETQCFWTLQPWASLKFYAVITPLIMDCSRAFPAQMIRKMN